MKNTVKKEEEIVTINNVVTNNEKVISDAATSITNIKKEKTYTEASVCMKNRMANKNFKKEFATLQGARWMLLQEIGRMEQTDTPFTYTIAEAKSIIDSNKESIMPTKSGKFTVNLLITFINKFLKNKEKEQKREQKSNKKLYSQGGLI